MQTDLHGRSGNRDCNALMVHTRGQCLSSTTISRYVDLKSQNYPDSLLTLEFWELKSTHFEVAKVEENCTEWKDMAEHNLIVLKRPFKLTFSNLLRGKF